MSEVFISYSRKDEEFTKNLYMERFDSTRNK
ncbi:hypothetical protein MHK_002855 [Candidatus Magnetomorum sp. HK-1]|nr:hypothetical protein MHK_002855 [Candidatus Magnetomorum sp. HK-1]